MLKLESLTAAAFGIAALGAVSVATVPAWAGDASRLTLQLAMSHGDHGGDGEHGSKEMDAASEDGAMEGETMDAAEADMASEEGDSGEAETASAEETYEWGAPKGKIDGVVKVKSEGGEILTGDPEAGERVFRRCMQCHVVKPGQHRQGPSLHGVIGRPAGSVEGYGRYSNANQNSGIVWTEQEMFQYLENPRQYIPGTIMAFPGLRKPQDRADVVAYIEQQTMEN